MNYELDTYRYHEDDNIRIIAVLTGLPDEEIIAACTNKELWGGQDFVRIFKKLGFNTNERFEKFDPDTDKPCIMRTTSFKKRVWFGWVYYKGIVYGDALDQYTMEEWKKKWPRLKITSLLQVWL